MESYAVDTELEAGDIVAPGAAAGSPLRIRQRLIELPHGICYRARQDGVAILLTTVDPVFVADPGVLAGLRRDLAAMRAREHRGLLPLHGFDRPERQLLIAEHDPGGTTIRTFVEQRINRGRPLDAEAAFTLIGQLCDTLGALHPEVFHGYINADTTFVTESGRVFLSSQAIGRHVARTPGFVRYQQAGRLSNVTPEQLLAHPQLSAGTDIYALAALFLEMVTGRPLTEPGQPIHTLGVVGPPGMLMCLERATAPNATARPPDVESFREELAEAMREGPLERHATLSVPIPSTGTSTPPPAPPSAPRRPPPPPPAPRRAARPARPAKPPPPPPPGAPEPLPSASSSLLGISLSNLDDIQLSTLDGESADVPNIGETMAEADADATQPQEGSADVDLDISRPGPCYFIVRGGKMEGPLAFSEISGRASEGDLDLDDQIHDRTNGAEHPVSSIPVLRRLLETVDERRELLRFSQQRAAPRTGPAPKPPPPVPKDRRALATVAWVVVVLAAFAGAGWWLMNR